MLALKIGRGRWAITENLVGIHCTGLKGQDFKVLADHGGSMVWSPLSNLLLYGQTADIAAAGRVGELIGLGSHWSVSGSKGLLSELKAARLAANASEVDLSNRELVAMVARDAARILRWDQAPGSLQPGLRADLLVTAGTASDPYTGLVEAVDTDIRLVVIDGIARYGIRHLVQAISSDATLGELSSIGADERVVNLHDAVADPIVAGLSLAEATDRLATALADLPALAARARQSLTGAAAGSVRWQLALDELAPTGAEQRPRLPLLTAGRAHPTGPDLEPLTAAVGTLAPLVLGSLTASAEPPSWPRWPRKATCPTPRPATDPTLPSGATVSSTRNDRTGTWHAPYSARSRL
ncbi:amidohydrolase family protein [Streptomyces sp. NPDC060028]|uniref:amidohydrolase family protein n=1 Tax=Streptomyces sp. NPDC060028 TaxID=3347041 RepID=UPI0036C57F9F